MSPPDFTAALCRLVDPDLFHPHTAQESAAAQAVCADCPLLVPCREAAVANAEQYGIWGGTTIHDRKALRRGRGMPGKAQRRADDKRAMARRMYRRGSSKAEIGRHMGWSGSAVNAALAELLGSAA